MALARKARRPQCPSADRAPRAYHVPLAPRHLRQRQAGDGSRPGSGSTPTIPASRTGLCPDGSLGLRRDRQMCGRRSASHRCTPTPIYGLLHTETTRSRRRTRLGEFFIEWNVRLDTRCVGGYCKPDSIAVYVNGKRYGGDPTPDPARQPYGDRDRDRLAAGQRIPSIVPERSRSRRRYAGYDNEEEPAMTELATPPVEERDGRQAHQPLDRRPQRRRRVRAARARCTTPRPARRRARSTSRPTRRSTARSRPRRRRSRRGARCRSRSAPSSSSASASSCTSAATRSRRS